MLTAKIDIFQLNIEILIIYHIYGHHNFNAIYNCITVIAWNMHI